MSIVGRIQTLCSAAKPAFADNERTSVGQGRWQIRFVINRSLLLLISLSSVSNLGLAQDPNFTLNINVDLVELRVTVLDEAGENVASLSESDFKIFEDKIEQQVALFRHDDRPVSLGLVIDNSRSMEKKKEQVDTAALSFVRESNPQDETFLIHFDDAARIAQTFTADVPLLEKKLLVSNPYGQTALYDAIALGLEKMAEAKYDQKAILIITDGTDNASNHFLPGLIEKVQLSAVTLYLIGLPFDSEAGKSARQALNALAEISGGRAFFPQKVNQISEVTKGIARELREMYTIGYNPSNARRDGTWRSVRVGLSDSPGRPRYKLNYRHGYYAPEPQKRD